jgi:hypothetical protein
MIPLPKFTRAALAAALAGAALALTACSDALEPLPREGVPDAFEFSRGGYGTGSRGVEVRGDTVVFRRVPWEGDVPFTVDSVRVVPTAEAWRAFWDAVGEAGVHRWRSRYAADVIDGAGWSLRIVAGGREIESHGSNAYPDRLGREHEVDSTPDFEAFADAVGALVGRDL